MLILFGDGPGGPDLLLVQRSPCLRRHAGQPAFPGGAIDESDGGPVPAALREAAEEAGVDPAGVQVLAVLPELFISRSGFSVTPVLAWWRRPVPVAPGDPAEISSGGPGPGRRPGRPGQPADRSATRPGYAGPAFRVGGMLVWGFTAMVRGPAARDRRLGAPVGRRVGRGPAARRAAGCGSAATDPSP